MNRREFLKTSLTATAVIAGSAILGGTLVHASANSKGGKMKILVITGSPRKNGNSNTLAEHFIRGAEEAGHNVVRFDAAFKEVHPCIGCNQCGMNGECVFKDDFEFVRKHILDAGMVVFATPMYYFGISAQIKAVIDRFYGINGSIHVPKKAALPIITRSCWIISAGATSGKSSRLESGRSARSIIQNFRNRRICWGRACNHEPTRFHQDARRRWRGDAGRRGGRGSRPG